MFENLIQKFFSDKSILIIGAGEMANSYAYALNSMKISKVIIISKSKKNLDKICSKYNFTGISGGYEKNLQKIEKHDLVIIATPTHLLTNVAKTAILNGQDNILLEKPGSLYSKDLIDLSKMITNQRIRIAWQRILYSSFIKLKQLVKADGSITSCRFNITEWIHKIDFKKYTKDECRRWGIINSLHVLSMVCNLIGFPKTITSYQSGFLDWHKTGSIFVGSGKSNNNVAFSYHGDWESSGRWEIDVMTKKGAYKMAPLEELYFSKKGTVNLNKIPLKVAYPKVKQGVAEEIALMLNPKLEKETPLFTLEQGIKLIKIGELIFGYH